MGPRRGISVGTLKASGTSTVHVGDKMHQREHFGIERDSYGNIKNFYQTNHYLSAHNGATDTPPRRRKRKPDSPDHSSEPAAQLQDAHADRPPIPVPRSQPRTASPSEPRPRGYPPSPAWSPAKGGTVWPALFPDTEYPPPSPGWCPDTDANWLLSAPPSSATADEIVAAGVASNGALADLKYAVDAFIAAGVHSDSAITALEELQHLQRAILAYLVLLLQGDLPLPDALHRCKRICPRHIERLEDRLLQSERSNRPEDALCSARIEELFSSGSGEMGTTIVYTKPGAAERSALYTSYRAAGDNAV